MDPTSRGTDKLRSPLQDAAADRFATHRAESLTDDERRVLALLRSLAPQDRAALLARAEQLAERAGTTE